MGKKAQGHIRSVKIVILFCLKIENLMSFLILEAIWTSDVNTQYGDNVSMYFYNQSKWENTNKSGIILRLQIELYASFLSLHG